MTFQQKLRKFSKQQLWNEYCGYLELNIKEYMYIQRRLMQEQINSWCASDLGRHIYKNSAPESIEEFLHSMPLTGYADYADVLFRRDPGHAARSAGNMDRNHMGGRTAPDKNSAVYAQHA